MTKKEQSIAKNHQITKYFSSVVKKKKPKKNKNQPRDFPHSSSKTASKTPDPNRIRSEGRVPVVLTDFFSSVAKKKDPKKKKNQQRDFPHSYASETIDLSQMKSEGRVPVVLISLFDGIGGALMALEGMQDKFVVLKAFYSEIDSNAREVTTSYFSGNFVDLGSVESISGELLEEKVFDDPLLKQIPLEEVLFLVVAGPPCQDLSRAKVSTTYTFFV